MEEEMIFPSDVFPYDFDDEEDLELKSNLDKLREECRQRPLARIPTVDDVTEAILKDVEEMFKGTEPEWDDVSKIKQLLTIPQETPEVSIVYTEPEGNHSPQEERHKEQMDGLPHADTSTKCNCGVTHGELCNITKHSGNNTYPNVCKICGFHKSWHPRKKGLNAPCLKFIEEDT